MRKTVSERIFDACAQGSDIEMIEKIYTKGCDLNAEFTGGMTSLHAACEKASASVVRFLLANGADPSLQDSRGNPPLHYAGNRADIIAEIIASEPLKCEKTEEATSYTNICYVNPVVYTTFAIQKPLQFIIKGKYTLNILPNEKVKVGYIAINGFNRGIFELGLGDPVQYALSSVKDYISMCRFEIETRTKRDAKLTIDANILLQSFRVTFHGHVFTVGQRLQLRYGESNVIIVLTAKEINIADVLESLDGNSAGKRAHRGLLVETSTVSFWGSESVKVIDSADEPSKAGIAQIALTKSFDFEKLGIGGLDKQFTELFRRAFVSRLFPPSEMAKYGQQSIRGILLYGPPGTGKTLIARKIGEILDAVPPKIVSGPEILNKFVGESELNVRALFKDAEIEQKKEGDASKLHVIIFDEIDAICRQRGRRGGSEGSNVGDSVVNQLLAKMDGVDQLNNILVIGMTNRKELIDEALLRPGRFELHIEISLPDQPGRLQILKIHTKPMFDNKRLADDVNLEAISAETKNYSGAEIAGLCRAAISFALSEATDPKNLAGSISVAANAMPVVQAKHFDAAIKEIKPAFGIDEDELVDKAPYGVTDFCPEVSRIRTTIREALETVRQGNSMIRILLHGIMGSGKTAMATTEAIQSKFPLIKVITPSSLVGYSDQAKQEKIARIFEDAHKSPLSLIVIDDIERIIDYNCVGPRFSNAVLQTLMIFLNKLPPNRHKLAIIATTSEYEGLDQMKFSGAYFDVVEELPLIESGKDKLIPIKKFYVDKELQKVHHQ